MQIIADEALAMILPIPVTAAAREDSVRFINLESYENFFEDLALGYPEPSSSSVFPSFRRSPVKELDVVDVGSFSASFVPTIKDFSRLDERFRLDINIWNSLPQYRDYGFAVFQLKPGNQRIHPMAFEFPRQSPTRLFFPTVHIHDGKVHRRAKFDHDLYCQFDYGERPSNLTRKWTQSYAPAGSFIDSSKLGELHSRGALIDPESFCYRARFQGRMKNGDIWL